VLFATGSPIIVDLEESLFRAGKVLHAGVSNRPVRSYLLDPQLEIPATSVTDEIKESAFLVALFTPGYRQCAVREAEQIGFRSPFVLIDPSVVMPRQLQHEPGLYVNAGCTLGASSEFGAFVFINRGAVIGHHVRLDRFVSIGPGAVLGGQVSVGKGSLVGAGAVLLPGITVGENSVIGAGAVVTRDVVAHTMVVGNPARLMQSGITGYKDMRVE
jgi:sugar O-acyltransferase (sialic acid O-acetyltransferase NeuD family)